MYRLVFLTGPHEGRRLAVKMGDVMIGRDADCHVLLHDPAAALRHAVLEQRPDGYYIRTLSAIATLRVNGAATREERLKDGDEIEIARERFLFQLIQADPKLQKRRSSKFHGLTFVAVITILLIQLIILAGLFVFWRMDPIHIPEPEPWYMDREARERVRVWIEEMDTGMLDSFEPKPFRVLPEWFVTPEPPFKALFESADTLDKGSAPDIRATEKK